MWEALFFQLNTNLFVGLALRFVYWYLSWNTVWWEIECVQKWKEHWLLLKVYIGIRGMKIVSSALTPMPQNYPHRTYLTYIYHFHSLFSLSSVTFIATTFSNKSKQSLASCPTWNLPTLFIPSLWLSFFLQPPHLHFTLLWFSKITGSFLTSNIYIPPKITKIMNQTMWML